MIAAALPSPPSFSLTGKRALVTGAGRGIGLGAAAALAARGAQVTLVARTSAEIEVASAQIRDAGGEAEAVSLDVTDCEGFAAWAAGSAPFDVFVNNAGTNRPEPFLNVSVENFDAIMALNARAAFFAAQAVARRLVSAGQSGSIINISSQMGRVGAARRSVYCASKWAMEGFTRAMALDLAPHGIRANTICPTFIATPMVKGFLEDPSFRSEVLDKIKLGRLGEVADVTGAIVFLASDASALMTGSSLVIDGGWTAE